MIPLIGKLLWGLFLLTPMILIILGIVRYLAVPMTVRSVLLRTVVALPITAMMLDPTIHRVLVSIPVGMAENYGIDVSAKWFQAFIRTGLYEETVKFLLLLTFVRFRRQVQWGDRKPPRTALWETVIPSLWVAASFAVVENGWYLFVTGTQGVDLLLFAIGRALVAAPGHLCDGVLMGFFYGLSHRPTWKRFGYFPAALAVPALVHGLWNLVAFTGVVVYSLIFLALLLGVCWKCLHVVRRDVSPENSTVAA